MRWLGLIFVFAASLGSGIVAQSADRFPYTAYIDSDELYVRSGPGKNYYPTDRLARGEAVEVYRHDPGGWCAIRPPRQSFSWVLASSLKVNRDGVGTVDANNAVARVGSAFSDVRDTIQVHLDRGELVEVLDEKQVAESGDTQSWYKIAPPSGEFRWVFGKFLSRTPPAALADDSPRSRASDSLPDAPEHRSSRYDARDERVRLAADNSESRDPRDGDQRWRTRDDDTSSDAPPPPRSRPSRAKKQLSPEEAFQAELNDIDLELSSTVAAEPNRWRLSDLHRRAESAVDRAQTALGRGDARTLLNKVVRFEDIQRRYDVANFVPASDPVRGRRDTDTTTVQPPPVANLAPPVDSPARESAPIVVPREEAASRYDGQGELRPVVSQRPGAPRYALVDATGHVTSFITPGPGVNLQPYLGRQVGVNGQRGFLPELKTPHVTAMHVIPTDGSVLR